MSRARDLADGTFSGSFSADSPTLVVDDTNNNVGVGITSPTFTSGYGGVHINKDYAELHMTNSGSGTTNTDGFKIQQNSANNTYLWNYENAFIALGTNNAERSRIDSSGNLLVGKTSASSSTSGAELRPDSGGYVITGTATSQGVISLNRKTSDGDITVFRKDGSTVGSIASHSSGGLILNGGGATNQTGFYFSNPATLPVFAGALQDNRNDLGSNSYRFDDIFATNGTIQTSDANEKQDVAELDEAERRVATAAKGLIRKFRWISSVEEKGDDARIHVGVIAQDLKAAFEAEGLDPGRYAMFISTTWWEADETYTDDEGVEQTRTNTYDTLEEAPEGAVERTRLGVRYNQLLAFIIGAM